MEKQRFPIVIYQRGAALMVSLIMLVLMTLVGLAAMRTSIMEDKMSANARDQELAFQAAEIALRNAESWLAAQTVEPLASADGSSQVWTMDGAIDPDTTNTVSWWQENARDETWWDANGKKYNDPIPINAAKNQFIKSAPLYIIEYQGFVKDNQNVSVGNNSSSIGRVFYRITTKGSGGSDQSSVMLQSTYARRF